METCYGLDTFKVNLKVSEPPSKRVLCPDDAVPILRAIYATLDVDQEHFVVLFLNNKNMIRTYKVMFSGGQVSSTVDVRIVFRAALLLGACGLVLSHNHPSGDPHPSSPDDIEITHRLAACGKLFGIEVKDHIILGRESYFSFADRCLLGEEGLATPPLRLAPVRPAENEPDRKKRRSDFGRARGPYKDRMKKRADAGKPLGPRNEKAEPASNLPQRSMDRSL